MLSNGGCGSTVVLGGCEGVTRVTVGECDVGLVTRGGCVVKLSDILLRVEPAEPFLRLL